MKNELNHHGILGQKWGVRRFQNKDGSLTALGKKHLSELQKEDPETYEQAKQNAIRSGNAAEIKSWSKMLTQQELNEAVLRIDKEKKLDELLKEKGTIEKGMEYVDKFAKYADTVNKAYTGYENLKKIKKAFSSDDDDDDSSSNKGSDNIKKALENATNKNDNKVVPTPTSGEWQGPRPPRFKFDREAYDRAHGKHFKGNSLGIVRKKNKH